MKNRSMTESSASPVRNARTGTQLARARDRHAGGAFLEIRNGQVQQVRIQLGAELQTLIRLEVCWSR